MIQTAIILLYNLSYRDALMYIIGKTGKLVHFTPQDTEFESKNSIIPFFSIVAIILSFQPTTELTALSASQRYFLFLATKSTTKTSFEAQILTILISFFL